MSAPSGAGAAAPEKATDEAAGVEPSVDPTAGGTFESPAGAEAEAAPEPVVAAAPEPVAAAESAVGGAELSADDLTDQSAIDELLKQASFDDPSTLSTEAFGGGDAAFSSPAGGGGASAKADDEVPGDGGGGGGLVADPFRFQSFAGTAADIGASSIDLLRDVELNVKIELGRSRMLVEDVLRLAEGSVVELDKLAGDPVDVFVNDRLVARGEVLVLNDNFCVRVNEIVSGARDEGL